MPSRRSRRVAELVKQEVAIIIASRLSDPRLSQARVTEVEMSSDLRRAYVYFSCARETREAVQVGFERARGFIKKQLAPRLKLKFMPDLVFRHDPSIDHGEDMDRLLASLRDENV